MIEWLTDVVVEERMGVAHASEIMQYFIAGESFGLRIVPGLRREHLSISSVETYFTKELNRLIRVGVLIKPIKTSAKNTTGLKSY